MTRDEAIGEIKYLRCLVRDLVDQSCSESHEKKFSGFISTYAEAMRWLDGWKMTQDFDDRGMRVVYTNLKDAHGGYPSSAQPVTIE